LSRAHLPPALTARLSRWSRKSRSSGRAPDRLRCKPFVENHRAVQRRAAEHLPVDEPVQVFARALDRPAEAQHHAFGRQHGRERGQHARQVRDPRGRVQFDDQRGGVAIDDQSRQAVALAVRHAIAGGALAGQRARRRGRQPRVKQAPSIVAGLPDCTRHADRQAT
jgi:hypothetical protein